ncbi:MAG: hypothetical protein ACRCUS_01300 [Anaerovoracaceae bacterium]
MTSIKEIEFQEKVNNINSEISRKRNFQSESEIVAKINGYSCIEEMNDSVRHRETNKNIKKLAKPINYFRRLNKISCLGIIGALMMIGGMGSIEIGSLSIKAGSIEIIAGCILVLIAVFFHYYMPIIKISRRGETKGRKQ